MKRIVVFLLSFLLLVFVSISVSGGNAFAKSGWSPPPAAVANLVCSVSATTFSVFAYSSVNVPTNVTVATDGTEACAQALADLFNAGLRIKDVQAVAPNVVYLLVGPGYMQQ